MFVIFSVFYILVAAAMIVLILLQNGAGADAGSGFGAGASATVFGARGSATFLTRATGVLAGLFFLLSLSMGIYLHGSGQPTSSANDLGVMAALAKKPATQQVPAASEVPAASHAPASGTVVPVAPPAAAPAAVEHKSEVPAPAKTPTKQH
ncbi:MAG: preprotein translocase subunit SecG [Pseudomonadota bacterium]|jgi:preprotein translocase subunit SecG|nr:preprotein translocase subunit SecG [Pseudomonadota bacterium]